MKLKIGQKLILFFVIFLIASIGIIVVLYSNTMLNIVQDLSDRNLQGIYNMTIKYIDDQIPGNWEIKNNDLFKGNTKISDNNSFVGNLKDAANADITFFVNNERKATTIKDSSGKFILNTTLDDNLYKQVLKDGIVYKDTQISGDLYRGVYANLSTKSGNVAILFMGFDYKGIEKQAISSIWSTLIFAIIIAGVGALLFYFYINKGISMPLKYLSSQVIEFGKGN